MVSAEDGYKSVELVEACYRSARKNKKIKLPLLDEEQERDKGGINEKDEDRYFIY